MTKTTVLNIVVILLWPISLKANDRKPEANINERYVVEKIEYNGIEESAISTELRDDAQKMVGEKYSEKLANEIAKKLRHELKRYTVDFKVERGERPDHVKVVFRLEKVPGHSISAELPLLVYHSKEGFSGSLEIPIETHHNVFTFGFVNDADRLLERDAGYRFRYEHRRLGTDALRLRIDFDTYHEKFNPATETALEQRPDVPGIYRSRQNLAPSLTLRPTEGLSLSAGLSLQRLQFQYPVIHTLTAYSGTADIRYNLPLEPLAEYNQEFNIEYSLHTATRILDSDFVYARHLIAADYTLSNGKHLYGAHFIAGYMTGAAPLFERFSFGNSATLRGWNKFDVAPLGGTRAAYGSLEYRYRNVQVFYDIGTIWDSTTGSRVRHGLGFGWASRHLFASLAFPVRHSNVAPILMIGFTD